jgi:prepilin-type N-terminal cleavage/methylation domain-containing protein
MDRRDTHSCRQRGFTLIEILAVILILGILASLLIVSLSDSSESAKGSQTEHRLAELRTVLGEYFNEFGDYPPSTFTGEQGVPNDGTNVGAEALVVALWSKGWDAGGHLADLAHKLVNVDQDQAPSALTDFASRELFEIPDAWENPIAYLHHRDYGGTARPYVTLDPSTGEEVHGQVGAVRDEKLGRFYQHASFQLVSAGPDGHFGTEDDLASFER